MANARERYDALCQYLARNRDARQGSLFGKACLLYEGEPFMLFYRESVAFRLHGRALLSALALRGASGFDPLNPDKPPPGRPGWVLVPTTHFLAWDRLAMDAMRCVRMAQNQNVSWKVPEASPAPVPAPPPSTPKSLAERVKAALSGGLLSRLTFTRQ
jgi:hypothetical protein